MEVQLNAEQFVDQLKTYSNQTIRFPKEIGQLITLTNERRLEQIFLDAIFHAKFATKTREVMDRIGHDGEGFDKLSTEFQNSVEKVTTLLKTIVKESPDDVKQHFIVDFFALDQTSFSNLLALLKDLGWIKNWEVDGKRLPLRGIPATASSGVAGSESTFSYARALSMEDLARIARGSALGFILTILLMVVDPPVGLIGWGIVIIVASLFLFISLTTFLARKESRTSDV